MRTPPGRDTRPTADKVRGAIFNALGSLGAVEGAAVLDLFAGSGAMGIEALSRGAASAVFVDHDERAIDVVRANVEATGFVDAATVRRADAWRVLEASAPCTLALLDPPYAFSDEEWARLFGALDAVTAVVESDREVVPPAPWEVLRVKKYGDTVVTIATKGSV